MTSQFTEDFVLLSTNFSAIESGWAQGNFNLDFRTDFIDFVALANNFGTDLSSGVSAQETVPEPASLVLLSLAVGFVARRRGGIKYPINNMQVDDHADRCDPIRRQLLGAASGGFSYTSPSEDDVPLRAWLMQYLGKKAVAP